MWLNVGGSGHAGFSLSGAFRRSPENSTSSGDHFEWLRRLEDRFELSAHGTQAFAPPETLRAWREHSERSERTEDTAAGPGSMGMLTGLTTRDAWLLDVFALGKLLRYMLTGQEPDNAGDVVLAADAGASDGGGPLVCCWSVYLFGSIII